PPDGLRGSASEGNPLERLDQLLKLVLVAEADLQTTGRDARREPRQPLEGETRAICQSRVERLRPPPRSRPRSRRSGRTLSVAHRQAPLRDPLREPSPLVVLGHR